MQVVGGDALFHAVIQEPRILPSVEASETSTGSSASGLETEKERELGGLWGRSYGWGLPTENSVTWPHLAAGEAGKCSLSTLPRSKETGWIPSTVSATRSFGYASWFLSELWNGGGGGEENKTFFSAVPLLIHGVTHGSSFIPSLSACSQSTAPRPKLIQVRETVSDGTWFSLKKGRGYYFPVVLWLGTRLQALQIWFESLLCHSTFWAWVFPAVKQELKILSHKTVVMLKVVFGKVYRSNIVLI